MDSAQITEGDTADTRVVTGQPPQAAPREAPSLSGRRLDRYLVFDSIGRGGMGEVHLAYDPQLDRRVALKVLRRDQAPAAADARLLREARALARLNHPNVVAVYDAGTVDPITLEPSGDEGGLVFLAMEYIEGVTLSKWLAEERGLRETLGALLDAGRGLAAAHAAGIVHRDFKPANVMVGEDGRVRVLDFGVARRFGLEAEGAEAVIALDLSEPLQSGTPGPTQAGLVVGTPRYMAPEQITASSTDARTDQFAFCVVTFEALFGHPPFPGKTIRELFDAMQAPIDLRGADAPGLPRAVRDALVRGLSPSPNDRHDDLESLLAVIERAIRPPPRLLWGAGAALLAGGIGLGVWVSSVPSACDGAEDGLVGVWEVQQREKLSAAFAATALPFAADAARGATAALDAYAEQWTSTSVGNCEATRTRNTQSPELMDLRADCLHHRREELAATVELLLEAQPETVEHALRVSRSLEPLHRCSDPQELRAQVPLPSDDSVRAEIDATLRDCARVEVLLRTGKYKQAEGLAIAALDRARALDHSPLLARAALRLASVYQLQGLPEVTLTPLLEALEASATARDTDLQASTLIALTQHYGLYLGDADAARPYTRFAHGLISEPGARPDLVIQLAVAEAAVALRATHYAEGEEILKRGLEVPLETPVAQNFRTSLLNNLAVAHGSQGHFEEAERVSIEATELAERELGPHHPATGLSYLNLAVTTVELGRLEDADELYQRADRILSAAFESPTADLARLVSNRAQLLHLQGDDAGAMRQFERALELKRELVGPRASTVAHTLNNIADLQLQLKSPDVVSARENGLLAVEIWRERFGEDTPVLGYGFVTLGQCDLAEGRPAAALVHFEAATKLWEAAGQSDQTLAISKFYTAVSLSTLGQETARAQELARTALPVIKKDPTIPADTVAGLEAWLGDR